MKKKTKKLKIKKENKMDIETYESFIDNKLGNKAIIEIREEELMPLYIFIANLEFMKTPTDFMVSIIHKVKTNELEIRGRMRYEVTQRKTVFTIPKKFKLNELKEAKKEIKDLYKAMIKETPFRPVKKTFELNFKVGETAENIIQIMEKSNKFNIGTN